MKTEISEKVVALIWQRSTITNVVTDAGENIEVIYPGRISNGSGCDFLDAVFTIDNRIIRGNVEIHVKSSQWYSHGHHRNTKYNDIALHVVMWNDSQHPTLLQNGNPVPTICLAPFIDSLLEKPFNQASLSRRPLPSCPAASKLTPELLDKLLDAAGDKRFAAKATSFQTSLGKEKAEQVLFRGIATALGYTMNANPFKELADRLPLSYLESVKPYTSLNKQAIILGTAGLLPSQRVKPRHKITEETEITKLETLWQSSGLSETMKETDWQFYRVRPDNFPTRRLAALSYLLYRYQTPGLLKSIHNLIKVEPSEKEYRWLEDSLTIPDQGYWTNHYDFSIAKTRSSVLLGRDKAVEIIINVILPFNYAWGEISADPELKRKAAHIYRRYPKSGENELTLYMKQQLLLNRNAKLSACKQQGLIHIFKTYCRYRNCAECMVAN